MKKLLVLLTVCATICAFGSCGEKEETSAGDDAVVTTSAEISQMETHAYDETVDKNIFVGKWECFKLVANGEEIPSVNGMPAYAVFQYNLLEDNTVALADSLVAVSDPETSTTYKWGAVSDTEVEITGSDGSAIVYVLNDGILENIDTNGEEIYLERVDEFQDFDFEAYRNERSGQYILTPVETDAAGNIIGEGEPITLN